MKEIQKKDKIHISINWQYKYFRYEVDQESTVNSLKREVERDIEEWNRTIVLSYFGKELKD